ncbi:hypothetical protein D3C78_1002340 [compost metagenome]
MFLIGTFRVITQTLHLPGGFRPPGAQRGAAFAVYRFIALCNHKAIASLHAADVMNIVRQAVLSKYLLYRCKLVSRNLDHRAQLFVEQRSQRIVAQRFDIHLHAAVAGKRHFRQRDQQAAVGTVMVSQQRAIGHQLLHGVKEARQLLNVAHVGRFVAQLTINLRQRSGTQRVMAVTQVDQQQCAVALIGTQLWRHGVADIFYTSKTGDHQ